MPINDQYSKIAPSLCKAIGYPSTVVDVLAQDLSKRDKLRKDVGLDQIEAKITKYEAILAECSKRTGGVPFVSHGTKNELFFSINRQEVATAQKNAENLKQELARLYSEREQKNAYVLENSPLACVALEAAAQNSLADLTA